MSYPRDLVGYGAHPPHARWPNGARIALQFVLNYEEGGENNVPHGDPTSETFLSELITAQACENRHMTMESMYEYGSRAGVWRILREFESRQLPLTVFGVGMALERYPELVKTFMGLGHEIANHGLRWLHYQNLPEATELRHVGLATHVPKDLSGVWPLGGYTGRDSPNTRRLVVEQGGYEYDSEYYGDDLPFWTEVETSDGRHVPHLVVPYSLDTNDMRFVQTQGFNTGEHFFSYLQKFGFPFMLAARGPPGDGLLKRAIIATFERRPENHPDFEFEEGLRNVHRLAELRLDDRFAFHPVLGNQAWDCAELLATHSDPGFADNYLDKRALEVPDVVGTMGMLEVPNGSTNVVPGRCRFTLDIRATTDPVRDDCVADVLAELHAICTRRGLSLSLDETMRAAAAPCSAAGQARRERAVAAAGLPVHRMPSGAGHDAMKLAEAMPQSMLFVRGENAGISHNPLESPTADDMQLAVEAFTHVLFQLADESAVQASP